VFDSRPGKKHHKKNTKNYYKKIEKPPSVPSWSRVARRTQKKIFYYQFYSSTLKKYERLKFFIIFNCNWCFFHAWLFALEYSGLTKNQERLEFHVKYCELKKYFYKQKNHFDENRCLEVIKKLNSIGGGKKSFIY